VFWAISIIYSNVALRVAALVCLQRFRGPDGIMPRLRRAAVLLLIFLTAAPAAAAASPIPDPDRTPGIVEFDGSGTAPRPVAAPLPPQHPYMAPNERSNLHVDAYQTDTNVLTGPLGREMTTLSTYYSSVCGSVTFDSRGRIVTVCVGFAGPTLRLLDGHTLDELASFPLPPRQSAPTGNIFQDFAGGGYFYLDDKDRAVIPTTTRHLFVVRAGESGFTQEQDVDLTGSVPSGDKIISALPDWSGLLWFVSTNGVVGTADLASGRIHSVDTGEPNNNSFAVDNDGGVYVVTNGALYRYEAAADGTPRVVWRKAYDNIGVQKPGQSQAGSGTTPTVMDGNLVSITDNADPMNVVVYRRDTGKEICRQPVFGKGAGSTDNSLIAAGRSIVVENNYGYTGPTSTQGEATTSPGVERVDIDRDGRGCRRVWHSDETSPSVVPKLSLGSGLVYLYTNPPNQPDGADGWYLTAVDFRTGKTVFRRLTGEGLGFNNNYAPVTIGPDGTAYVGTLGGLVALRDTTAPPQGLGDRGGRMDDRIDGSKPHLSLKLKRLSRARVRVTIAGRDRGLVRRADFKLGSRRAGSDRRAPFARTVSLAGVDRRRAHAIRAVVRLDDGTRATLKRTLRTRQR
jgi:hypothetical protein